MFTKNDTFEQIMNTKPVRSKLGNLFPSCWLERILPQHYTHTMAQIEAEDTMEWGAPFLSDAFVESANVLMEAAQKKRFRFVPLWNTQVKDWIPDADLNCADSVYLLTGNPDVDALAFAHTAGAASVPPYPSTAVPSKKRERIPEAPSVPVTVPSEGSECVSAGPDADALSFASGEVRAARPAVIICPGGAYYLLSSHSEGTLLAQRMERDGGYKAFVLNYRVQPNYYPLPQMDLALAVMHVRAHAEEYGIDPNRIFIVGASAGGHLCASEAYLHETLKREVIAELLRRNACPELIGRYQNCSARPDGVGLLYPVISFLTEYHEGSYLNLTGDAPGLRELLSVEQHITPDYPPVYAFANEDDGCVPASNTRRLDEALERAGVLHLCQIFPTGDHGVGLGYEQSCRTWSEEMLAFFERV